MKGLLDTHSAARLYEAFEPEVVRRRLAGRLEIHHTPKHSTGYAWRTPNWA